VDAALDQAGGLELAQAPREQAVGEARHARRELGEVVRALGQRPEDGAGPATANQLYCRVEVRAYVRRVPVLLRSGGCPTMFASGGLHPDCETTERPFSPVGLSKRCA